MCRQIEIYSHVYGLETYQHWLLQWQIYLPKYVSLDQTHPLAFREFANSHIQEWWSAGTTTKIKSWIERGGSIRSYVLENMDITPLMVTNLQAASIQKLHAELLRRPAVVHTPAAGNVQGTVIGGGVFATGQGPVVGGKGQQGRHPKQGGSQPKPMGGLKGYCLTWLRTNVMPCSCQPGGRFHRPLRHKDEWDNEVPAVRSAVVQEAKRLSPNVVVKVQP
jgi:hypothetical protein